MKDRARVESSVDEHIAAAVAVRSLTPVLVQIACTWWTCLQRGGQVLFCGNGGSAGDSQHLAAELLGRYETERRGLRAIALTTDSSVLTATSNDYGYERVFARQVEALARPGDVLVALSTSGRSPSVLAAAAAARAGRVTVVGFTGAGGGALAPLCGLCLQVPSRRTARIQEMHMLAGHCCCELIDAWIAESTHVS